MIDRDSAPRYTWGDGGEGFRLVDGDDLSVIQERLAPGCGEVRHHHARARQLFFVLAGRATMHLDDRDEPLEAGQAIEIAPGVRHRIENRGDDPLEVLVVSAPTTRGDRIED